MEEVMHKNMVKGAVNLMQSLIGRITPSFRRVYISHNGIKWILHFFIEKDSEENRESIEDVACYFEIYSGEEFDFDVEITVTNEILESISDIKKPNMVVFWRNEEHLIFGNTSEDNTAE